MALICMNYIYRDSVKVFNIFDRRVKQKDSDNCMDYFITSDQMKNM